MTLSRILIVLLALLPFLSPTPTQAQFFDPNFRGNILSDWHFQSDQGIQLLSESQAKAYADSAEWRFPPKTKAIPNFAVDPFLIFQTWRWDVLIFERFQWNHPLVAIVSRSDGKMLYHNWDSQPTRSKMTFRFVQLVGDSLPELEILEETSVPTGPIKHTHYLFTFEPVIQPEIFRTVFSLGRGGTHTNLQAIRSGFLEPRYSNVDDTLMVQFDVGGSITLRAQPHGVIIGNSKITTTNRAVFYNRFRSQEWEVTDSLDLETAVLKREVDLGVRPANWETVERNLSYLTYQRDKKLKDAGIVVSDNLLREWQRVVDAGRNGER